MTKRNPSHRLAVALLLIFCFTVTLPAQTNQPARPDAATQAAQARRDAYVVMISIDGLIPEYYTAPAPLGLRVPTLTQMKLNGAYAEGVEGVYPILYASNSDSYVFGYKLLLTSLFILDGLR